jgi:ATP-binding cassette subfamily B protein
VLVLDDPLSALDVATEARVEAELRAVLASTTALIVAHRPSTVMLADRVALLEEGRITAVGTHSELLRENEHYAFVISSLEDEVRREAAVAADRVGLPEGRPVSRSGSEGLDTRPTASGATRPPDSEPSEPIEREEATR